MVVGVYSIRRGKITVSFNSCKVQLKAFDIPESLKYHLLLKWCFTDWLFNILMVMRLIQDSQTEIKS